MASILTIPGLPAITKTKSGPFRRRRSDRTNGRSSSIETWPSLEQWNQRQQALAARTFRKLGIKQKESVAGVWASQVLDVLGPGSFAPVTAIKAPGKLIWCNFDLARQVGFTVPRSNQLTPEFEQQLLAALSLRAVTPAEDIHGQETITIYADKYGGDGVLPGLGAGRAGFLAYGNLYVKGMGFTPLFKHNDPTDFAHSHGAVHLDDCLSETIFGEVNENLFALGSSRVLAVIDQGKEVVTPSGRRISVALVVRAGSQLRPAHILAGHVWPRRSKLDRFVSMARATGQLVTHRNKQDVSEKPDLHGTMLRIIDDHARTSADAFRWRMIHGALSASNMELSGAMLDLPTQSTQPRTAAIRALDYADSAFGSEHIERASRLANMYRVLVKSIPATERRDANVLPLDIETEMRAAYQRHLQVTLLSAVGLKVELAQRLQVEHRELAVRFVDLLLEMMALRNPGTTDTWKSVVETVSVLDVFHLLQKFPRRYFANSKLDHSKSIRDYLKPVFRGNRFHIAKKQETVRILSMKFDQLFRELMGACDSYASEYYCDLLRMRASIIARSGFENEPLESLYAQNLRKGLDKAIALYRATDNVLILREAINQRVVASMRSVNGLLAQGNSRRLKGGGVELEARTIDGINYCVRAWNDDAQTRRLHVSIPVERKGRHFFTEVPNLPPLTKEGIASLRYRFTIDGRKSFAEVKARLTHDSAEGFMINFDDIAIYPMIGQLEGSFPLQKVNSYLGVEARCFAGYTFAIPDKQELMSLVTASAGG